MAVANALGANVQNVFLALAIPWTVQVAFPVLLTAAGLVDVHWVRHWAIFSPKSAI